MIVLTQNKSLEVVLAGSVTTNQLQWSTSYLLIKLTCCNGVSNCETRLSSDGNTNNSTRITIVPIPTASDNTFTYTNNVEFISIINTDTAPATLTLQVNDTGTRYKILTITMSVGDQLIYNEDSGFQVFDSTGGLKMTLGATTITSLISAGSYIIITGSGTLASPYVISADATTTATASKLVVRDANGNAYANNFISNVTAVVSAGGTTTLNASSARLQILTGTLAQTFKLPSASTFPSIGATFEFNNNSTGLLTVIDGNNGAVTTVLAGAYKRVVCTDVSSPAGVWDWHSLTPKNVQWGNDGATAGKTIELDFPITDNRVLTFPDITDTVVTLTASQNLTNKTTTTQSPGDNSTKLATTAYCDGNFAPIGAAITVETEQSTTPITDNAEANGLNGIKFYAFFTLPTTYKFYYITGIEWKNGTVVNGTIGSGVEFVDANPPVNPTAVSVVIGLPLTQTGTSSVQRNSTVISQVIPGGTILGAWLTFSSATATARFQTGLSNINRDKNPDSYTATPPYSDSTAWLSSTNQIYIKVYYKGVN